MPFGLFAAIYLVEYGDGGRFSKAVTAMVDVMTGIPSIVAGLFAYALFVLFVGARHPLRARRRRRTHGADDARRGPYGRGDAPARAERTA